MTSDAEVQRQGLNLRHGELIQARQEKQAQIATFRETLRRIAEVRALAERRSSASIIGQRFMVSFDLTKEAERKEFFDAVDAEVAMYAKSTAMLEDGILAIEEERIAIERKLIRLEVKER